METIKLFCDAGHALCELRVVGENVVIAGEEQCCTVSCFPWDREVHLGPCRRCADERTLQRMHQEG
jgi:hypothetical protein